MKTDTSPIARPGLTRRSMLKQVAAASAAGTALSQGPLLSAQGKAATKGNIKQSVAQWCFESVGWNLKATCENAKKLGIQSVELLQANQLPTLKKYGLSCAIVSIDSGGAPPFVRGFNNPKYWPQVLNSTRDAIDAAAAFGSPNVISFTGYSARDVDDPNSEHLSLEEGADNCVKAYKQVISYAEQKGVTLCLEMLNTRDDSHPMKGHPGYQGDNTEYCVDIIERVGSPRLKLLFDIYHVQIMDGDIIRRIHQHKDHIAHIHTAGNPGRAELDERQEINYAATMRALLEIGYQGFVGQEFIPTRDPYQGLREAVLVCDV